MKNSTLAIIACALLSAPIAYRGGAPQDAAAQDPTAALLSEVIRVNTSNPPGREGALAELLAPRFRAAGFTVDIVPTPEAGKAHFIARLKGDGSKRPILLAAHADVVGVEREKWTLDPFAGIIRDGYVFGRGRSISRAGLRCSPGPR